MKGFRVKGISLTLFGGLIATTLLSIPICLAAEPFFAKGSATTPYSEPIESMKRSEYDYFPQPEKQERETPRPMLKPEPKKSIKTAKAEDPSKPPTKDEILAEFGDPTKAFPVRAIDDAPLPFRGFIRALGAGHEDLAKQYAKQFLDYNSAVAETSSKAQGYYREILQDQGRIKLSPSLPSPAGIIEKDDESFNEQEARLNARKAIQGSVPVDKQGQVDVYYFIDITEKASLKMIPELEKLHLRSEKDKNLSMTVFLSKPVEPKLLQELATKYKVNFPIMDGQEFVGALKIERSPTLVMVARTSQQMITEEGLKKFYYLDELVNAMQGKR